MQIEDIICAAEIETPRNPEEFVQWFDGLVSKINGINDHELKNQTHCHVGMAKWFYEEAWPIYELLKVKRGEWQEVNIQCIRGNQPYDAFVHKKENIASKAPNRIEVTLVIDGLDNSIRMKELCSRGEVSLTSAIIKHDDGKRWIVDPHGLAKATDETVVEICKLLEIIIQKKVAIKYDPGTALIIYVDDYGTFRSEKHFAKLKAVVEARLSSLKAVFLSTYLIASLGSAFAEF